MQFRVLGRVEVLSSTGQLLTPRGRLHQLLLVALLLRGQRPVTAEDLVDLLWDGRAAPVSALANVRTYVLQLRRMLGDGEPDGAERIETTAGGYLLKLRDGELDAALFEDLVAQGRDALGQGRPAAAVERLTRALGLWRGPAAAQVALPDSLRARTTRLEELRLSAVEDAIDARLAVGQHSDLVAELHAATDQHPLRERLWAQRMLALYRSGRQADALSSYQRVRAILTDELGIDPGPDLRRLHQQILTADPGLDPPAVRVPARRSVPAQLPADTADFTGREAELADLDATLSGRGDASPTGQGEANLPGRGDANPTGQGTVDADRRSPAVVVISAVSGTAGVGKTALAVRWAHRVADRFPDGQLYVNLRGYDPDQPLDPADALSRFLRALGVSNQDIPLDVDERAARFRTEAAGRRMLIVLDNASTVEQVRPLLPGSGTCAVLVTSRDSLAGLVAVHGAHRLDLDLLCTADAVGLLRRLIGARARAQPDATAALAARCARLPLALRVAAELAVCQPGVPLAELVRDLADQQRRLDLLDAGGDPRAAVATVFSWSVQHLPEAAAGAFRRLGLHPGPEFDPYAAAALTGTGTGPARRALDLLARAHLVHPTGPGRYGMHDLLRAYATQLATAADSETERRAALTRLFDYYLATAETATGRVDPAHTRYRVHQAATTAHTPSLADARAARSWLDIELPNLTAMAAHTAAHGWPTHTIQLSTALYRYLDSGRYTDALAIHGHARQAAQHTGDRAGQARALLGIGAAQCQMGAYLPSAGHLNQALALARQAADLNTEARVLGGLGMVEHRIGHNTAAVERHRQALTRYRQAGDRTGEARTLSNLGVVELPLGRYEAAAEHFEQALARYRQLADHAGETNALNNLGMAEQCLGRYEPAAEHLEQALARYRQLGNPRGEASALDNLGTVLIRLGRPQQAAARYRRALALFREIGDRDGEAWVLNGLGEAAHAAGRPADALAHHTAALNLASHTGAGEQWARADTGLGHAHRALGQTEQARTHYERAAARYTALEMPAADDIRTHLNALPRPSLPTDPSPRLR